ncbi:hypothetical protein [Aureibacillus halotolerans]|uniref:Uncharacterized protein n=1 Tax=Aureibacillus halotolerans TaxID=1508390 RepID=A0A4R6TUQ2_9BACI|nr:hypothetical protein [Aureibacillus halotolerans]TDQ37478.1 hypothetical protein EV213_113113 [Aureibacillus halotolerans]
MKAGLEMLLGMVLLGAILFVGVVYVQDSPEQEARHMLSMVQQGVQPESMSTADYEQLRYYYEYTEAHNLPAPDHFIFVNDGQGPDYDVQVIMDSFTTDKQTGDPKVLSGSLHLQMTKHHQGILGQGQWTAKVDQLERF